MTTREDMDKYLNKIQKWQRMAQGICDYKIEISFAAAELKIYVTVHERDEHGYLVWADDGGHRYRAWEIDEYNDKAMNDRLVKDLSEYLEVLEVL